MKKSTKVIALVFLFVLIISHAALAAVETNLQNGGVNSAINKDMLKLKDCYIYPLQSNSKLKWNVELEGIAPNRSRLEWSITDKNSKVIGKGIEFIYGSIVTWESVTFGMKPWSDKEPNLYQIEIKLITPDGIIDTIKQPYGLRSLVVDGISLRLNGRLVMLRGTNGSSNSPLRDRNIPVIEHYRNSFAIQKSLGFNFIRWNKTIPSEECMQAADELGLMFQVEATGAYTEQDWEKGIRRSRKHPSVIIYCCGNEEIINEAKIEYLRRIAALQKSLAPDGLFSPMESLWGVEAHIGSSFTRQLSKEIRDAMLWGFEPDPNSPEPKNPSDIVLEPFQHNAPRLAALKEFSDVFAQYSWGWLSTSSVYGDWKDLNKKMTIYERPLITHETGISGSLVNLNLESRYKGMSVPKMYINAREQLTKAGLLDRADIYYENSCAWQLLTRKYNIEMSRKCKYIMGYDMLGSVDVTGYRDGYPCGLMNEFYELKPGATIEDILKYNGESVVLLDCYTYRNLLAGKAVSFDAMSSLYGDKPIDRGKLEWWLSDGKSEYSRGTINLQNINIGEVENLGAIKFTAPMVNKPIKLNLHVRLTGGEYNLTNDWNFWVFPSVNTDEIKAGAELAVLAKYGIPYTGFRDMRESTSKLKIVSTLDEYVLQFIYDGGRVVLLKGNSLPFYESRFQLQSAGRPNGNFATVITKHPMLKDFPNDGYCDWQFYPMMEGGSGIVFNNPDIPFDPIVELVNSYMNVTKQSSLFEFNVGKGKLLVCSMNLNVSDPGGNYLMHSILSYAAGDSFKPRNSITIDQLEKWMAEAATIQTPPITVKSNALPIPK